ncbi:hypothetical protein [Niastella populi]|uniref:Uncharacterized protein n=1 Tax=Niastella populi TaxID=550983 RepID=A0A1V9FTT1_9BACT|nr:hypothetical protein [Niastella populi]OQP61656.1 hypothetical protein A4R26_19040 [Niastella populi]
MAFENGVGVKQFAAGHKQWAIYGLPGPFDRFPVRLTGKMGSDNPPEARNYLPVADCQLPIDSDLRTAKSQYLLKII